MEENGGCEKVGRLLVKRRWAGEEPFEAPTVDVPVVSCDTHSAISTRALSLGVPRDVQAG